jgi:anthranilate phosphoribosyltransferase
MSSDFRFFLDPVRRGESLTGEQSSEAFETIMKGGVEDGDLADFLLAQAQRGPTVAEIAGAARAMRANMITIDAPPGAIDLCGTGGDGRGTLNISTAVSFVVAACGVPVAKHGNRNMSSRTGAADVLEALGANVTLPPEAASACVREVGLCFLFAPLYHPAMKHVAPIRKRLGTRTIFNLLGPVCNPAGVRRQLLGVYAKEWLEPIAHVLDELGTERAWVVHGSDGMDEMTTTGITHAAILENGNIRRRSIEPEEAGARRSTLEALKGGNAKYNAERLIAVLEGQDRSAYRDIVVLNAAAALIIAGKVPDLRAGADLAGAAIDQGQALAVLSRLLEVSREAHERP